MIRSLKQGETFNLEPGETVSFEIPITINIPMSGTIGKIVANYEDKYGNKYEAHANFDIKDIIEKGIKMKINGAKIIYYGPFKKRIPMIVIPILIIGVVVIIAYLVTDSIIPLIVGIGTVTILEIIIEIIYMRVNKRYNDDRRIDIVKEV